MRFSDSHHFRRMIAGCCMAGAPLFVLVGFIVSPAFHNDAGDQMASFAAHQDRLLISTLAFFVATVLAIGAALGLMHMLRERMVAYGHAGGALALIGLVALAAQAGTAFAAWQMTQDGVQASDVAAWDGIVNSTATVIMLAVLAWIGTVGFVVLAAGLYRARAVDWWMAAMLAIGVVGLALATPLESVGLGIVASAVFLVGLGSIGAMVLRETDAEWEHTPEYPGFRPAMRMG